MERSFNLSSSDVVRAIIEFVKREEKIEVPNADVQFKIEPANHSADQREKRFTPSLIGAVVTIKERER
jgi:hypothetical protein